MNALDDLVKISNLYGSDPDFVIAGGGNTSYKNETTLWVKASGTELASVDVNGFVVLDRLMVRQSIEKKYSNDSSLREQEVKIDLLRAKLNPEQPLKPSVETAMHEIIDYPFVVHTHPTIVNGLMCAKNAAETIEELFGDTALFIPCTQPGYVLSLKVAEEVRKYHLKHKRIPAVLFLENHGVVVGGKDIREIQILYNKIFAAIKPRVNILPDSSPEPVDAVLLQLLPALRMKLSDDDVKIIRTRNSKLIRHFCSGSAVFSSVSGAFTPDHIVYCKSAPMYVEGNSSAGQLMMDFEKELAAYVATYGFLPKVVLFKGRGMLVADDTWRMSGIVMDVFENAMMISWYSQAFGGPRFMKKDAVAFIEGWDAEAYRKKIVRGIKSQHPVANKVAVVTGGAQGFGRGIASQLFSNGANVVIADLNDKEGMALQTGLNNPSANNHAVFVKTDISNSQSVETLIQSTVESFGGIDIFISNAGILHAGSLDEMKPETFELMTKVNYSGYFLCAKYVSQVMKQQNACRAGYYTDIIQINSKSGLRGSNKNFAYAGGKFGGIGLTQSFALELMPFNIKVNSVCPGNFFEGPLWSDPEKGLFVQYLRAGKVPGAKTIDDVKKFYESQVPAGRGCRVDDVMKAIYYIISQEYETGQAIPVTGGQVMLN